MKENFLFKVSYRITINNDINNSIYLKNCNVGYLGQRRDIITKYQSEKSDSALLNFFDLIQMVKDVENNDLMECYQTISNNYTQIDSVKIELWNSFLQDWIILLNHNDFKDVVLLQSDNNEEFSVNDSLVGEAGLFLRLRFFY